MRAAGITSRTIPAASCSHPSVSGENTLVMATELMRSHSVGFGVGGTAVREAGA
jgi:hypothetical protein